MNERYYTIKQAAEILGVTPLTLRNWDKKGLLVAYRNPANNYRLYRYADVADFLAAIKQSGPRQPERQRLQVRREEETAADGTTAVPEAEVSLETEPPADAEFSAESPTPYGGETPAGEPEWQAAAGEEQSDAGAV